MAQERLGESVLDISKQVTNRDDKQRAGRRLRRRSALLRVDTEQVRAEQGADDVDERLVYVHATSSYRR
jgi:hypothetical protein